VIVSGRRRADKGFSVRRILPAAYIGECLIHDLDEPPNLVMANVADMKIQTEQQIQRVVHYGRFIIIPSARPAGVESPDELITLLPAIQHGRTQPPSDEGPRESVTAGVSQLAQNFNTPSLTAPLAITKPNVQGRAA
jgi:hypothetical protein